MYVVLIIYLTKDSLRERGLIVSRNIHKIDTLITFRISSDIFLKYILEALKEHVLVINYGILWKHTN